MKRLWFVTLLLAGMLFTLQGVSQAAGAAAVDGNDYDIYFFCMDSVGDYCDQYQLKTDKFVFDDGEFEIDSFEGEFGGYSGEGDYSDAGPTFSADYEVISEDIEKYKMKISGITLTDGIVLGTMEIEFYEWDIFDWDKEEEGTAYFLGTKK